MLENYKLDMTTLVAEGYDPKLAEKIQENNLEFESWRIITESRQNQTILQTEVIGLEDMVYDRKVNGDKIVEKKSKCAVIEVGTLRGCIPMEFLGLGTEEKKARGLLGQKVAFVVIAIDREAGLFVGSRTQALNIMVNAAIERLNEGDEVFGVVRQVFIGNMMVDVGGITTSIPASEVSYAWVDSLRDHYSIGNHVKVKITDVNKTEKTIKASIKALLPDPFENFANTYKLGGEYVGRVSGVKSYGVYVTIRDGVSGLAPLPQGFMVEKGDKVKVRLGQIKPKERHVNLRIISPV